MFCQLTFSGVTLLTARMQLKVHLQQILHHESSGNLLCITSPTIESGSIACLNNNTSILLHLSVMIMMIKSSWKTTRNPLEQLPLVRLFTNQQKAQISRLQESSETQTKLPGFILNNCSQIVEPRNGNPGKFLATTLCR